VKEYLEDSNVMIEKVNNNNMQNLLGQSSPVQSAPAGVVPNKNEDASLQIDYAALIDKAINAQQADADAVQRAKELLKSGQLESPQNIRAAAENILELGI
jgi:hypothetical protein